MQTGATHNKRFGAKIAAAAVGWSVAIVEYRPLVGRVAKFFGFVGPLILWPENNLGPLMGIFLTGPLGFVGGAVIGLCIGLAKERRQYAG
jgi:hypothetical protein